MVLILGVFDIVEVDVQDREQVRHWRESRGARERERKKTKQGTTNGRSTMWHHGWHADGVNGHAATLWATMWCKHMCKSVREKLSCEVYLSTLTVGYSRSLSTVNDTKKVTQSKKTPFFELTSNSIQTCPTTMRLTMNHRLCWFGWRRSSTCSPDSWCKRFFIKTPAPKSDRSFIGPFLPAFVQSKIPLSFVSSLLWSEFVCVVFFCKFIPTLCTFVLSIRLRFVIHDKSDLLEIDREYL